LRPLKRDACVCVARVNHDAIFLRQPLVQRAEVAGCIERACYGGGGRGGGGGGGWQSVIVCGSGMH
jgi:hypothetical protein